MHLLMKKNLLPVLAAILPLPLFGAAQGAWTADALVERALAENAELRFYEAEVAAARGQRTQAGLWKNPELSGEYGQKRTTGAEGSVEEGFTRGFSLAQTFEFPGKGSLRKAMANKEVEIAELGLKQFKLALQGRVRLLALEWASASATADAAAEISERSSGLIQLLRERRQTGTQQLLELRVIEGSLLELQVAAKEAVQAKDEARIELNALLGFPSSHVLALDPALLAPPPALPNGEQLILTALSQSPLLKMRIAELEKAVREVSSAKLEAAPDFSVGPFFSQDEAGEREETIGVTLSTTLPLWNWNQGSITNAKARRDQADARLLEARRRVEAEAARRLRAYAMNQDLLKKLSPETLRNLQDASDLADRQYRTGAIGVQLFIEVQREYLNSRRIRNDALLETWKNWLDLQLLIGEASPGATQSEPKP